LDGRNRHYKTPFLRNGYRSVPPGRNQPTPLPERIGCSIGCLLISALFIFMFVNMVVHLTQP